MSRMGRLLEETLGDVADAARALVRSPSFTLAAVATLAVGVGAATAIFSVADAVLIQPLRFRDASRLVAIAERERPSNLPRWDYGEYREWRTRTSTLDGLAAYTIDPQLMLRTPAGMVRLSAGLVSANFFEVLGVPAQAGRALASADEGSPDVAVLSDAAWRRYFAADPAVLGTTIEARSGTAPRRWLTIVGVMPADMEPIGTPLDLFTIVSQPPGGRPVGLGTLIGRLSDSSSVPAAEAELNTIGAALRPPRPASAVPLTEPCFGVTRLQDDLTASLGGALQVFLAAVAVLLAMVCANVANLLLARGSSRHREIGVRLAIGAGWLRVARLLAAESVLIAMGGGLLGVVVAAALTALVSRLATVQADGLFRLIFGTALLPRVDAISLNARVLVAAFTLAGVVSVVSALLPALRLSRASASSALGLRGGGASVHESRLRMALVVAQVAMASALLVAAGLLVTSFLAVSRVQKGYEAEGVIAFQLVLPDDYATARKAETVATLLDRLRAVPSTEAAGFAYAGVLVGIENTVGAFVAPSQSRDAVLADRDRPRLKSLSPGYLEAIGARAVDGRLLTDADRSREVPAVVVNEQLARRYFGEARAVGAVLDWYGTGERPLQVEIVGVVSDIRQASLERPPYAEVFMDYREVAAVQEGWGATKQMTDQLAFGFQSFAVRTAADPRGLIPRVRDIVREVDAQAGIDAIAPLEQVVSSAVARRRFNAVVLGLFALVAALLAAVGIYGVLATFVVERTQEIGVRLALGARPAQLQRLLLRRGVALALTGLAIGLSGAAAGTRYLQGLLFGVTPLDRTTFAAVALTVGAVAALAAAVPARRAMRVDPAIALRHE